MSNKDPKKEKDDFSEFFVNAKSSEKAKIIRQVLREANLEQSETIRKYKSEIKTT